MRARPLAIAVTLVVLLVGAGCRAAQPAPGPADPPAPTSPPAPPGADPASPAWGLTTLDGSGDSVSAQALDVGQFVSGARVETTNHLFYRDATNGYLRHAWDDGTGWQFEVLDGDGGADGRINADVGTDVEATVVDGTLEVFYYDITNGDLRHAALNGSTWAFESLDGNRAGADGSIDADVGSDVSVALTATGPTIFYYDVTEGDLRTGSRIGSTWTFATIDGNATGASGYDGDVGQYTSSLVAPGGVVHVFTYDDTATVLRHAWLDGSGWHFETVDGDSAIDGRVNESVGSDTTTLLLGGVVHVWYYDIAAGALRHAWLGSSGWQFETIDGTSSDGGRTTGDVGQYVSAAFADGAAQVFYYDVTNGDLRHATLTGSSWVIAVLDGGSTSASQAPADVGLDALAIIRDSHLSVFYYDVTNGNLLEAVSP